MLPSRYAFAAFLRNVEPLPNRYWATSRRRVHTPVFLRSSAFPPFRSLFKLSREERPRGSLPAFAWGHVSTPIHPITEQRSLFPQSYARTAISRLCSQLSPKGAIRGFHVPLAKVHRVRCLLLTGRRMGHESARIKRCSLLQYLLVQA